MDLVFPGVELTFAIFMPKMAFKKLDFPTLDLPAKAISFLSAGGRSSMS